MIIRIYRNVGGKWFTQYGDKVREAASATVAYEWYKNNRTEQPSDNQFATDRASIEDRRLRALVADDLIARGAAKIAARAEG